MRRRFALLRGLRFAVGASVAACGTASSAPSLEAPINDAACGAPLQTAPPVRQSSFRQGDCDFGEAADFIEFDGMCLPNEPCPGSQNGDLRCHRICDDGKCASSERCEQRPAYVSDTPTRHLNLCLCADEACEERGPEAKPWPPEGGLDTWRAETDMPIDLYYHAAAANPESVYVSGGLSLAEVNANGSGTLNQEAAVYAAPLDGSGTLGDWSKIGELETPLTNHAMAVFSGRLYVAGGAAAVTFRFSCSAPVRHCSSSAWGATRSALRSIARAGPALGERRRARSAPTRALPRRRGRTHASSS